MHLSFIDIVFSVIVLFIAISACVHGFIAEIFGKIAVIASFFTAFYFCGKLAAKMQNIISVKGVCVAVSFAILFIATFLAVKIIQTAIKSFFSGDILKSLDRLLGFVLGFLEGIVILYFLIVALQVMPFWDNISSYFEESFIYNIFNSLLNKKQENASENFALLWQMKNNYQNI